MAYEGLGPLPDFYFLNYQIITTLGKFLNFRYSSFCRNFDVYKEMV
jgi:hypothetical protein